MMRSDRLGADLFRGSAKERKREGERRSRFRSFAPSQQRFFAFALIGGLVFSGHPAPAAPAARPAVKAAMAKGVKFLKAQQGKGGAWQEYPGVTALAALALIRSGATERDPAVAKAMRYLLSKVRPDGAIYSDAN